MTEIQRVAKLEERTGILETQARINEHDIKSQKEFYAQLVERQDRSFERLYLRLAEFNEGKTLHCKEESERIGKAEDKVHELEGARSAHDEQIDKLSDALGKTAQIVATDSYLLRKIYLPIATAMSAGFLGLILKTIVSHGKLW